MENKKVDENKSKRKEKIKVESNAESIKELQKISNVNYITGIIGAVIGGFIGAVPWILAYIYGNMMIAILAIFIAGGAYYGYKLCKGKVTKKLPIIIMLISIIIVAITSLLIIPIILIHTEGLNVSVNTIKYLYQNSEFEAGIIRDTIIAVVFTVIGGGVITAKIKQELAEGTINNKEQTLEEFEKVKEQAIEQIKPIFEKYNAVSKGHTIEKIELEAELEEKGIDKKLLDILKSVEIVKKEKGKFYYEQENENKEVKPKKKINKSKLIAIFVVIIAIIASTAIIITGQYKKNETTEVTDGVIKFDINTTWTEYTNYYTSGWNYYKYISNFPIENTNEVDVNNIDYTTYPAGLNVSYFQVDTTQYDSIEKIRDYMVEYINSAEDKPEIEQEISKTEKGYDVLKLKATYNTEPEQIEYMYYILNNDMVATVDIYSFNMKDENEIENVVKNIANSIEWVKTEIDE